MVLATACNVWWALQGSSNPSPIAVFRWATRNEYFSVPFPSCSIPFEHFSATIEAAIMGFQVGNIYVIAAVAVIGGGLFGMLGV